MPYARRNRISVEEKGQRAARSTDVYLTDYGLKEVSVCPECRSFMMNKRWYSPEDSELMEGKEINEVVCPACRRMSDNLPDGILTLSGDYLLEHEDEILNTLKNEEAKTRKKNPLARIMEIRQEGNVVTIHTTSDKLAQKMGRDIFKAHRGNLHYNWSGNENFLRVSWER